MKIFVVAALETEISTVEQVVVRAENEKLALLEGVYKLIYQAEPEDSWTEFPFFQELANLDDMDEIYDRLCDEGIDASVIAV